jgi:hypothetical protein
MTEPTTPTAQTGTVTSVSVVAVTVDVDGSDSPRPLRYAAGLGHGLAVGDRVTLDTGRAVAATTPAAQEITVTREIRGGTAHWVHVMVPIALGKKAPYKAAAEAHKWARELGATRAYRVSSGSDYNATQPGMARYSVCYGFEGITDQPTTPEAADIEAQVNRYMPAPRFSEGERETFRSHLTGHGEDCGC